MKKFFNKNALIAIIIFLLSGTILYLVQRNVYKEMETLAVERTKTSINESLNEYYDSLNELALSYNKDLKGRVETVAMMLKSGREDEILRKASKLCEANRLFIEGEGGNIIFSADDDIKGKPAKEVLNEFIEELDKETEDYASAKLANGNTLWLCDHTTAIMDAKTDPEEFLLLGDDLSAFNAGSARIILWSILLLGIAIALIFSYGEYLLEEGVVGKAFVKKCFRAALISLIVIGVVSFYTQTLECISSAIDTADNTGDVLREIRAQHISDTDNLDSYYETHDKRRISLIAACIEEDIEKTKDGIKHTYREEVEDPYSKVKDINKIEIVSFSENAFLKDLMEKNNLNNIYLMDKDGCTISSGTDSWYYDISGIDGFKNVLDGKLDFYNDEHTGEGYRLNAVKCGDGILVVSRPWYSEDKNIRMRKEFIYDAAESYMNARLIQTKEEEEEGESTNSFEYEDDIEYFRHRINARSLNEGNYLVAYYPNDFLFKTRFVMILWTIGVSILAMAFLIFYYSKNKVTLEYTAKKNKKKLETILTTCFLLTMILVFAYSLQGIFGGESISAIQYIMNGDWHRGFNFFALSACVANIFGALVLQQIVYNILKIASSDLADYQKERFNFVAFIISILIFIIALFTCLYNIGLNLSGILASAGIISAIVGIACQNIISNYLNGIKNIFDDTYRVGEWVKFEDFRGVIVDMSATDLKIKDSHGNIMKVYHQDFINAINLSRNTSTVEVIVPVAFSQDISIIENSLKNVLSNLSVELKEKIIGEPIMKGVVSTDGDGKDILFYIDTKEEDFDFVKYKFSLEIIDILNKAGIETPTPSFNIIHKQ